ncbi:hypothetical protein CC86DRAFT_385542 [Ophiobolus disseminans]|uniref:Major facilitator superfamily (MFS) profile domain-containing protein n=1 Tax=Ophiobolus disseminans TaxID=1469910 RepID=A0A6A6ZNF4_9PLEO|nr:hypothetical protein CC86DRAFT_385542 [Ophiobolus disseminans]
MAVFAGWQWRKGDAASIPAKVIRQRTVLCSAVIAFIAMGSFQLTIYYLPIWFQVIKGVSPTRSGVLYLPTVGGDIALSILGGLFVQIPPSRMIGLQVLLGSDFGAIIQTVSVPICSIDSCSSSVTFDTSFYRDVRSGSMSIFWRFSIPLRGIEFFQFQACHSLIKIFVSCSCANHHPHWCQRREGYGSRAGFDGDTFRVQRCYRDDFLGGNGKRCHRVTG